MAVERTGEAFELDEKLTVIGKKLTAGDPAPDFALDHWDGTAMQSVSLADSAGSVRLLNVVNSLDTPVCEVETRRWEQLRTGLPTGGQDVHHQHGPALGDGALERRREGRAPGALLAS